MSLAPEAKARIAQAWTVLEGVPDPEVPAVSVCDLGIVRAVEAAEGGPLQVVLTPTYSGCPATEMIEQSVVQALESAGLGPVVAVTRRDPAWSTDWISEAGREKLRAYGIAPPQCNVGQSASQTPIRWMSPQGQAMVACPRCASPRTEVLSQFGSTACKALYRCLACREPFEYFKPH